jgi:hypothetical protein
MKYARCGIPCPYLSWCCLPVEARYLMSRHPYSATCFGFRREAVKLSLPILATGFRIKPQTRWHTRFA